MLSGTSEVMHEATWQGLAPGDVARDEAGPVAEWPSFSREVFGRLYRPEDEQQLVDKPEAWAQRAHSLLEQQADWLSLRQACAGNALLAARAARTLEDIVRDAFGPPDEQGHGDPAELQAQQDTLRRMQQMLGLDPAGIDKALAELERLKGRAELRRIAVQAKVEALARDGTLGKAIAAAKVEVDKAAEEHRLLSSFGVDPGRHVADAQVDSALAGLVANSEELKAILRAMGAMLRSHHARELERGRIGQCDVVGVVPGRDLSRLTSSERARLAHPTLRADVIRRTLDGAAQTYELRGGLDDRDRGDVIVCVDRSGSMDGARMVWARAVAAATLALATRDGRRVVLVLFSNRAETVIVDGASPTKAKDLVDALSMLAGRAHGGTDAVGAVTHALSFARPDQPPDVLVITDAELGDTVPAMVTATAPARARKGRVTAVLIAAEEATPWADAQFVVGGEEPTGRAVDVLQRVFAPR